MEKDSHVYKSAKSGQSLVTVIASSCRTPILSVKYSNLVKPYYYPNSAKVPRYSVTCLANSEEHKEFISDIQSIEKNEKVETVIKNDFTKKDGETVNTGNVCIKFQGKDLIPIFVIENWKQLVLNQSLNFAIPQEIRLEDELAHGEKIMVVYDILRYTKKNTPQIIEHGLNFKPISIFFYPET